MRSELDDVDLKSFGLVTEDDTLTSAGALLADQPLVRCSRVFCTRFTGEHENDLAARLGGDEFALLLVCDPVPSNHVAAIRRIEAALEAPVGLESTSYRIRASLGIAVYPQDGNESLFLLKRADDALYRAKRSGRNTYCFYTSSKPPSS